MCVHLFPFNAIKQSVTCIHSPPYPATCFPSHLQWDTSLSGAHITLQDKTYQNRPCLCIQQVGRWTAVIGWCLHKKAGEKGVVCFLLVINICQCICLFKFLEMNSDFFIANSKTEPLFAIIRFVNTEKYCLMTLGFSERASVNCRDPSHFLFHDLGSQWLCSVSAAWVLWPHVMFLLIKVTRRPPHPAPSLLSQEALLQPSQYVRTEGCSTAKLEQLSQSQFEYLRPDSTSLIMLVFSPNYQGGSP